MSISKKIALLLTTTVAALGSVQAAVYESPLEFIAYGDLDGDGNPDGVIVDRATGSFRVAYQVSPGDPAWAESRASGIDNVTGVTIGRLINTSRDALAFTSPSANRINLIDVPDAASPAVPVTVSIPSVGPNLIGASEILGAGNTAHDDLYVVSEENPGDRESLVRNTGTAQSSLFDGPLTAARYGADQFEFKLGIAPKLGLFQRGTPADRFVVMNFSGPVPSSHLSVSIPIANTIPLRSVAARFAPANPLAQMLFYSPGTKLISKFQAVEPSPGTFSIGGVASFFMPETIQSIQLIPHSPSPRLLVLSGATSSNATVATVYSFDGTNNPTALYSSTNAAGYNGALALGNGQLSMLVRGADGRSSGFENRSADGTLLKSGNLPRVTPASGQANVLLFTSDPFVAPSVRSLKSLRAGEWSSAPTLAGGAPPSVTVRAERFLSSSNGLGSPANVALGAAPAGTTYAMVNQYTNPISIFSARSAVGETPAEAKIQPTAGEYPQAIKFSLSANVAGWNLFYRLNATAAWQTYASPVTLFSNAIVQFYAREGASTRQTQISSAAYRFPKSASEMDSDGDGVPDYVEVANGLNPKDGSDSDGDGRTDLEELICGSQPNNPANLPACPPMDSQQAFDLVTIPHALDPNGQAQLALSNVLVTAYSPDGRFHTNAYTAPVSAAARLISIEADSGDRILAQTTDLHFRLTNSGTNSTGHELIGLLPTPSLTANILPPGNIAASPAAWIADAAVAMSNAPRHTITNDLTLLDSATAALFEAKVAQILVARGTNWGTNLTLFPWRFGDSDRTHVTSQDLLNVESHAGPSLPGYALKPTLAFLRQALEQNASAPVIQFRALISQIHQINAAHFEDNPGALLLPFSVMREFIQSSVLHSNHVPYLSGTVDLAQAFAGAQYLLGTVPSRPTTNVVIEVAAVSPGEPTQFRLLGSATPVTLWTKQGHPCPLPDAFNLVAGSRITVFGHVDIAPSGAPAGGLPIEVISSALTALPVATGPDSDGNLLLDAWENALLGGNGNPFGDDDGDGFINLEEQLAGTDPNNSSNKPSGQPASFVQPVVTLGATDSKVALVFDWPAAYVGKFTFGVQATTDLNNSFNPLKAALVPLGGDTFRVEFETQEPNAQFFRLTIALNL